MSTQFYFKRELPGMPEDVMVMVAEPQESVTPYSIAVGVPFEKRLTKESLAYVMGALDYSVRHRDDDKDMTVTATPEGLVIDVTEPKE